MIGTTQTWTEQTIPGPNIQCIMTNFHTPKSKVVEYKGRKKLISFTRFETAKVVR